MSLTWDGKWDPYYSRVRRAIYMRPSTAMALNNEITTAQSLIDIVQSTIEYYWPKSNFDRFYCIDCDEVYPNIFIGDGRTAKEKGYLKKIGITHVLNAAEGKDFGMVDTDMFFYDDVGFKYLGFQILDHPSINISNYFQRAADFIHNAICSGGKVYVHCLMGKSRSSTCVIAYLMLKKGMTAAEAIRTIKEKRSIYPNVGFLQQLADLDNSLRTEKKFAGGRSFLN